MKIVLLSLIICSSFSLAAQKTLLNALEESYKKASSSTSEETIDSTDVLTNDSVFVSGRKYKESYSFSQMINYKVEVLKDKKHESLLMTTYFSDGALITKSNSNTEMNSIYDVENESIIIFNEKDMTVMILSSKMINGMTEKLADDNGELKITKTGNTKLILGHTCEEYIMEDDKTKTNCWISSEIKLEFPKTMSLSMGVGISVNYQEKMKEFSDGGMMMEMTSYNKKGEVEIYMIITEFKEESVSKSLSGYELQIF